MRPSHGINTPPRVGYKFHCVTGPLNATPLTFQSTSCYITLVTAVQFISFILVPSVISGLPRYLLSHAVPIPSKMFSSSSNETSQPELLFLCILLSEDHSILMPVYMVIFYILPFVLLLSLSLSLKYQLKRKRKRAILSRRDTMRDQQGIQKMDLMYIDIVQFGISDAGN